MPSMILSNGESKMCINICFYLSHILQEPEFIKNVIVVISR